MVGHADIVKLKKNTKYTISVYQYLPENPDNKIGIGTQNNWQYLDNFKTFKQTIVESDSHGKIFLEFHKKSTDVYFSGISVSRTIN